MISYMSYDVNKLQYKDILKVFFDNCNSIIFEKKYVKENFFNLELINDLNNAHGGRFSIAKEKTHTVIRYQFECRLEIIDILKNFNGFFDKRLNMFNVAFILDEEYIFWTDYEDKSFHWTESSDFIALIMGKSDYTKYEKKQNSFQLSYKLKWYQIISNDFLNKNDLLFKIKDYDKIMNEIVENEYLNKFIKISINELNQMQEYKKSLIVYLYNKFYQRKIAPFTFAINIKNIL